MLRRLWQMRVIQWGLGGGLIASICCVGPPLAILLGLSSASFLVGATAYSPVFYAVSVLLLVAGVLVARRKQQMVCNVDEMKRNRWLVPLVAAGTAGGMYLLLTQIISPVLVPTASDNLNATASASSLTSGQTLSQQPRMTGVRRAELSIAAMT